MKKILLIIAVLATVVVTSCQDDYPEVSTNNVAPNLDQFTPAPPDGNNEDDPDGGN